MTDRKAGRTAEDPAPRHGWMMLRRLGIFPAVGVIASLLLSACFVGNQSGPRVVIGGDSITSMAANDIESTLTPAYGIDVQANGGYTWAQQWPGVQGAMQQTPGPNAVIIDLGTNDAMQVAEGNESEDGWTAAFTQFIQTVQATGVQHVFFWTVNANSPYITGVNDPLGNVTPDAQAGIDTANWINSSYSWWAQQDPAHFSVIDYYNTLGPSNLQSDLTHPNDAGEQVIANWDAEDLAAYFGS